MNTPEDPGLRYEAWVASLPAAVQALAAEFPMAGCFNFQDGVLYLIGWVAEPEQMLIMSHTNPAKDPAAASRGERIFIRVDDIRRVITKQ